MPEDRFYKLLDRDPFQFKIDLNNPFLNRPKLVYVRTIYLEGASEY